ncbi:MAG: PAS domain-containing hybrid sensor histidine kinase/response regulator [Planctomycetota bacterium]
MTIGEIVLAVSIVLQLVGAFLALRLIRITERKVAWSLLALGFLAMAVRRALTLAHSRQFPDQHPPNVPAEAVALFISIVLVFAVSRLGPHLRNFRRQGEALGESEARFRSAFQNAPIGMVLVNLDRDVVQVNQAFCRMLGYREEEIVGHSSGKFTHPDDLDLGWSQADRLLSGAEQSFTEDKRYVRKDGHVVWVRLSVSLVRDGTGQPLHFIGQIEDVTQRKRAVAEIRAARDHLQALYDASPDMIFEFAPGGRLVDVNENAVRMLGFSREHFLAGDPAQGVPEGQSLESVAQRVEATLGGEEYDFEWMSRRANGEEFPVEVRLRRIEGGDTAEPRVLAVVRDITNRREAEAALRSSEARFRELVENMNTGVMVIAAVDDGRQLIVRDVNRAAERIDGLARTDVVGRSARDVFPGAEASGLMPAIRRVVETGRAEYIPATMYADERITGWREYRVYRVPSGEIVAIYDDVTEKKRLQDELVHAQRMEAVGRLAGGVAHDFNNLLQVILGITQLLRVRPDGEDGRRAKLEELEEQVWRGVNLTRQLLFFSRREPTQVETADLNDVLTGASRFLGRLLKENVRLETRLDEGPLPARIDVAQIEQVLMNLAVNAADAMPQGGRLTIRSGGAGDRVWFSLEDTGPGIPAEIRDEIFEPFFTTKSAARGTGLGLSVAHGIVTEHGGDIRAEDGTVGGACFRVVLPREKGTVAPHAGRIDAGDTALPQGAGQRVLVVEDEEGARLAMADMLVLLGYEVTAVEDARAAMALPEADVFEVLLTDMLLPDVTGLELAQRRSRGTRIPVPPKAVRHGHAFPCTRSGARVRGATLSRAGRAGRSRTDGTRALPVGLRDRLRAVTSAGRTALAPLPSRCVG